MVNERVKKILIILVISMLSFNFIGSNVVMAINDPSLVESVTGDTTSSSTSSSSSSTSSSSSSSTTKTNEQLSINNVKSPLKDSELKIAESTNLIGTLADGIFGIFTYLERIKIVIVGGIFQLLGSVVATSAGTTSNDTITVITPEDILFNRLAITDINFFNLTSFGSGDHVKTLSNTNSNPIYLLKKSVAGWYMTLRTMSMIILVVILVYIGIRMVIASTSEGKANYKQMFMNWLVSLALVFLLHYIILFVISANNVLVDLIGSVSNNALNGDNKFFSSYITSLLAYTLHPLATVSWTSAIVYVCIVALTFIFLIMYIKRMITIAFLILISPIITITYSIDKVGNGKAEAFTTWMKEFFHNVLIQPFHCIIYVAFVSVAMNILKGEASLASAMLIIITMFFILQAEGLIKKIFGITSESTGSGLATAAVLTTAYNKLGSSVKKGKANIGQVKATGNAPMKKTAPTQSQLASNNNAAIAGTNNRNIRGIQNNNNIKMTEDNKKKTDDFQTKLAQAQADDYSSLMGWDDEDTVVSKTQNNTNKTQKSINDWGASNYNTQNVKNSDIDMKGSTPTAGNQNNNNNSNSKDSSFKKKAIKGLSIPYKVFKKGNLATSGLAGAAMGGALAGMADQNIANVAGAMATGHKAQEYMQGKIKEQYTDKKEKISNVLDKIKIKNDERELAASFAKHKNGKKYNKKSDIQEARKYLNMKPEEVKNIKNESEKHYVQSLHAMRNVYAKNNYDEEDPNERVIRTMEKVVDKDIQPKIDNENY